NLRADFSRKTCGELEPWLGRLIAKRTPSSSARRAVPSRRRAPRTSYVSRRPRVRGDPLRSAKGLSGERIAHGAHEADEPEAAKDREANEHPDQREGPASRRGSLSIDEEPRALGIAADLAQRIFQLTVAELRRREGHETAHVGGRRNEMLLRHAFGDAQLDPDPIVAFDLSESIAVPVEGPPIAHGAVRESSGAPDPTTGLEEPSFR